MRKWENRPACPLPCCCPDCGPRPTRWNTPLTARPPGILALPPARRASSRPGRTRQQDRSKSSALIPPGFGTPTSYLPNSGST